MAMTNERKVQKKKERTFVDGGVLMTHDEKIAAVKEKVEAAQKKEVYKLNLKQEKAL
jgi:hypothetical protein